MQLTEKEKQLILNLREKENRNPNYVLHNFDDNLRRVIEEGMPLMDRTGTGCRFLTGVQSVIDISKRIPISTRREVVWKSMLKEYLWFLTGSHEIKDLQNMGSKVWNSWQDLEFAKKHNFPESSIGYGYGQNLINSGAKLGEKGVNQIDYVINELKANRASRRALFDFWRADKVNECKLVPCHLIYQFICEPDETGELNNLSCSIYQRSSDSFIGNLSTNMQGAAFYCYMIAQQLNMKPNKLYHTSGHFHIYDNHIELAKEYLSRPCPNSPILKLNKKDSIYNYTADDFILEDYYPLEKMKVPIAV